MTPHTVQVPTKLQVACIVSILLLIELAACCIALPAVNGGSVDSVSAATLSVGFACIAILSFLSKLGLQCSWFHGICGCACTSFLGIFNILQAIQSYQQSHYWMLAWTGITFTHLVRTDKFFVATPSSLPKKLIDDTHDQAPTLVNGKSAPSEIWIVFSFAAFSLILTVRVASMDDNSRHVVSLFLHCCNNSNDSRCSRRTGTSCSARRHCRYNDY